MTIHDERRLNFLKKSLECFKFLVDELGYQKPQHKEKGDDDWITVDEIIYENQKINRLVMVSNAYHPNDYGFEVDVYDLSQGTELYGDYLTNREMIYCYLS